MANTSTNTNQAVELLFSVEGGGSINGASGQLIQSQITSIAKDVKAEVTFTANVSKVKEALENLKKDNSIVINVNSGSSGGGGSGRNGSALSVETKETTELINSLKILKKEMSQLPTLWNKANQVGKEGTDTTAAYSARFATLYDTYAKNKEALVQYNIATQTEIDLLDRRLAAQTVYTQAQGSDKEAQNAQKLTTQYSALQSALSELINRYSKWKTASKDVADASQEAVNILNTPLSNNPETAAAQVETLKNKLKELSTQLSTGARNAGTVGTKIRQAFSTQIVQLFATAAKSLLLKAFQSIYSTVVEINSAMAQLQIVTKASVSELADYAEEISDIAKSIGSSISDLTESVTTFARLGFSLEDSTEYATLIAQYAKVADTTVSEATTNMTAAIKAFGIAGDEFEEALDKLIKVGNSFAVSSSELGSALNNAASALAAQGNSYDEALGIFAAANATVQDIDKASTAVRTIAARISASTTELEELGETTDDVLATADLANEMAVYGVAITDANGELLSTYDILSQVAATWDDLNKTQQSAITGLMAGTRQSNIFASIMTNWSDAEEAVEACASASGELEESYEIVLDSIEGKLDVLSTTWESFSEKVLDSSLVKFVVDMLNLAASALDRIADIGDGAPIIIAALAVAFTALQKLNITGIFKGWGSSLQSATRSVLGLILPLKTQAQVELEAAQAAQVAANTALIKAEADYNEAMSSSTATAADKQKAQAAYERAQAEKLVADTTVESAEKSIKSTNSLSNSFSQVASYAMLACMAFSIVNSALEDTEYATEKGSDGATLMAVAIAAAITSVVIAVKIGAAAITGAIESIPIVGWVLMAVSALTALGTLIASLCSSPDYDELKENAQDLQEEWQEAQDELEETTDKITELEEELENLKTAKQEAGYSLADTSAYDAEIAAIESEINELKILAQAKEDAAEKAKDEAAEATAEALNQYATQNAIRTAMATDGSLIDKDSAATMIAEYAELLADYTYGENSALDEYFEQYYWLMSRYAVQAAESVAEGITDVLSISKFSKAQEAIQKFADGCEKSTDVTAESLQALAASDEDVQAFLDYLVSVGAWDGTNWDTIISAVKSLRTNLVKLSKIDIEDDIESMSDKFDALSDALEAVSEYGILSADALQKLLEEYPTLLAKYFTKTTEGYSLGSDYLGMSNYEILKEMAASNLEEYIEKLVEAQNTLAGLTEEDEEYENALYNLAVAQDNVDTKMLEWATLLREAAIEEATETLEAQQDALEDQLDAYEDLIDSRKELLETYQEEVDYQKELASKQKSVSDLQTQLAVAQLDTSASGQAKVRELEEDLAEAQEELDDFTLEHAIEELTDSMDEEYEQYKSFIDDAIDEIDEQIATLSQTISSGLANLGLSEDTTNSLGLAIGTTIGEYLSSTNNDWSDMNTLYADILEKAASGYDYASDSNVSNFVNAVKSGDYTTADSYYSAAKSSADAWEEPEETETTGTTTTNTTPTEEHPVRVGYWKTGAFRGTHTITSEEYKNQTREYNGDKYYRKSDADYYVKEGEGYGVVGDDGKNVKIDMYSFKPGYVFRSYHTGGYVGGDSLRNDEEFAKLLQGEYVVTPKMIENFQNNTLPQLATVASSGGGTINYNSPLISLQCDSVTESTLPQLESMINSAISKLKDEIDSGASRAGYKTTSRYKI